MIYKWWGGVGVGGGEGALLCRGVVTKRTRKGGGALCGEGVEGAGKDALCLCRLDVTRGGGLGTGNGAWCVEGI